MTQFKHLSPFKFIAGIQLEGYLRMNPTKILGHYYLNMKKKTFYTTDFTLPILRLDCLNILSYLTIFKFSEMFVTLLLCTQLIVVLHTAKTNGRPINFTKDDIFVESTAPLRFLVADQSGYLLFQQLWFLIIILWSYLTLYTLNMQESEEIIFILSIKIRLLAVPWIYELAYWPQ